MRSLRRKSNHPLIFRPAMKMASIYRLSTLALPCPPSRYQLLTNLHCIGRCTLANLIPTDEQLNPLPVFPADILPDSSDEDVILSARFEGHREMIPLAIIHNLHPWRLAQNL